MDFERTRDVEPRSVAALGGDARPEGSREPGRTTRSTEERAAPESGSSFWKRGQRTVVRPGLTGEKQADVAIVGAGITGLTLALALQRAGLEVVVIEAGTIGAGTSGATSAHVTEVPDLGYRALVRKFGKANALAYARSCRGALDRIERAVREERIDCGFRRVPAYQFTENREKLAELEEEERIARSLGIEVGLTTNVPLFPNAVGALRFEWQAQFHPLRYVNALAHALIRAGGALYTHSRVRQVKDQSDHAIAATDTGSVSARAVVLATHVPIGRNVLQTEVFPYRSYMIARSAERDVPAGLFFDMEDPYHYVRDAELDGQRVFLIGGADHKTGCEDEPKQHYLEVEAFAARHLGPGEILQRWSGQLYVSADGLPYVGKSPFRSNVYVATGFAGCGLVQGALAAEILTDALLSREHPAAEIVSAGRIKLAASANRVLAENVDAACHFLRDRVALGSSRQPEELAPGEGSVIESDGRKIAVARDGRGVLHFLSPQCTHLGCIVHWNDAERTWDCPCHGGRFSLEGAVIEGPPVGPLRQERRRS